jgi:hypothetical protein
MCLSATCKQCHLRLSNNYPALHTQHSHGTAFAATHFGFFDGACLCAVRRGLDTYVEEPALIKKEQAEAAAARLKRSAEEELLACEENLEGADEITTARLGHKVWVCTRRRACVCVCVSVCVCV